MIRIELPYPLPTWNRILAMNPWQRKKLRDMIHASLSALSVIESCDTTLTVYRPKQSWTALYMLEYLQTIRPNSSRKSALKAIRAEKKEPSSKSIKRGTPR